MRVRILAEPRCTVKTTRLGKAGFLIDNAISAMPRREGVANNWPIHCARGSGCLYRLCKFPCETGRLGLACCQVAPLRQRNGKRAGA